jgi:hypothetical protein
LFAFRKDCFDVSELNDGQALFGAHRARLL